MKLETIAKKLCEGKHFPNPKKELEKTRKDLGGALYDYISKDFNNLYKKKNTTKSFSQTENMLEVLKIAGYYTKYITHVYNHIKRSIKERK